MLQTIRDRVTGKFAVLILVLIALPFVFFGINSDLIGVGFAAKVNGEEISAFQFENAYQNQLLALAEQGTEIPAEFRELVREGVLDRMIREELLRQYLIEAGYTVSDQIIADIIQADPTWAVDGQFSREAYDQWLELRAIDHAAFEEAQRRTLAQDQLQRGVAATAFVTPSEYRRYLNLYGERRLVSLAEMNLAEMTASIEVSDEDIQAYYDARPDDFQSPESVDVTYVELNREQIAESVEVAEDELRQLYEDTKGNYLQDEQRQARHILILFGDDEAAAEEQATALTARVQAGEPFEDLARQYSDDTSTSERGGDLGLLLQTQLPEALGEAVFALEAGGVTGPVRTDFGFHVVRLDDIQAGGALPLEQVRNDLLRELRRDRAEANYSRLEDALSDALFDAPDMAALAEASGLELKVIEGYARSGGGAFGSNQAAIDAVFDPTVLEDRELSDIVELDANRAIVVGVSEYYPASRQPLDAVRASIESAIKNERAFTAANDRVTSIQAALADGASLEDATAEMTEVSVSSQTLSRQTTDVSPRVVAAVFQEKKPAPGESRVGTVVTGDQRYVVYSLVGVAPGRPESIPLEERDQGKLQLAMQSGSQDFASLIINLETGANIVKSEDVLQQQSLFE